MNDQLQAALTKLAEKLGTSAEHLWGVLIRQARIEIWTNALTFLIGIILAAASVRFWLWFIVRYKEVTDSNPLLFIAALLGTIFALVFCIAGICALFEIPTLIANPEYWALKEIMSAIK